jgi:hypothetical protein
MITKSQLIKKLNIDYKCIKLLDTYKIKKMYDDSKLEEMQNIVNNYKLAKKQNENIRLKEKDLCIYKNLILYSVCKNINHLRHTCTNYEHVLQDITNLTETKYWRIKDTINAQIQEFLDEEEESELLRNAENNMNKRRCLTLA